jgi:hypothetical protein
VPIVYDPPAFGTATFDGLVEEVLGNLQGYTLSPDQVTYLTADIAASDTAIKIAPPQGGLGVGMIEVGDELMQIVNYDEPTATATVLPKGRGWRGTTASAHTTGDTVTITPLVPRYRVKKAINDVVNAVYPLGVFAVGTYEFQWSPIPTVAWGVPADALSILDVRYKDQYGNWDSIRHWDVVRSMNTDSISTGVGLRITQPLPSVPTVRVVYGKRPTPLSSSTAPFTDSGLSVSAKDMLVWGAMARLVPALDAGRLGVQYVPADELDQPRQVGSAVAIGKEFNAQYQAALAAERQSLQNQYPAKVHFVR